MSVKQVYIQFICIYCLWSENKWLYGWKHVQNTNIQLFKFELECCFTCIWQIQSNHWLHPKLCSLKLCQVVGEWLPLDSLCTIYFSITLYSSLPYDNADFRQTADTFIMWKRSKAKEVLQVCIDDCQSDVSCKNGALGIKQEKLNVSCHN